MHILNFLFYHRFQLLCVLCLSLLYLPAEAGNNQGFNIAVSILPQKKLVEKIAGEEVNVLVLVKPGQNPVTYDPSPRQLVEFSRMDVYFYLGVPFEKRWLDKLTMTAKHTKFVDLREGIEMRQMRSGLGNSVHSAHEHAHFSDGDRHDGVDPHIWLSPSRLIKLASNIRLTFSMLDPENKMLYEKRYRAFESEMQLLRKKITRMLEKNQTKSFLVFHPSWGYFADEFGLKQIAIETDGKSPSSKSMARVIRHARENNIKIVFVQKQFSQKAAANIADAIGGRVVELDPLAEDVPGNLELLARTLVGVIQ